MRYLFVIERAPRNLAGYFPDVPGCVSTAKTVESLLENAREALELHLQDEPSPPAAHSLQSHLAEGLDLGGDELLAWVEYEHNKSLASA